MGAVYEAESVDGGGDGAEGRVAIKLMHPELLRDDSRSAVARFHREARAASAVDTEHIVRVLDFGTDPEMEAPYLVMELLRGEDFGALLDRVGRLQPEVALKVGAQVCVALEKAHAVRVIHRDIKPANLFVARNGTGEVVVKILDFGLAKIKPGPGELTSTLTQSGNVLASPRYMSPEQARGEGRVDFRTDLWSLGLVLYHALTGHLPYHQTTTLQELIMTLCSVPLRFGRGVPAEVASVVHRALELEREERFESATAMLEAIRPLLPGGWSLDESSLAAAPEEAKPASNELPGAAAGLGNYQGTTRWVGPLDVTERVDVKKPTP